MTRALLLSALVLLATPARAGNQTYCVGGFGPWTKPCNSPAVTSQHRQWHFHTHLSDGKSCYECYDEVDDSCETDFLKANLWRGWKKVDKFQCDRLPPAPDRVYALMNRGLPQVSPADEARSKQEEMQKILEEAKKEAERLKAEQARKAEEERLRREEADRLRRAEEERIRLEADAARRRELERQAEEERKKRQAEIERLAKENAAAAEAARLAEEARLKREEEERKKRAEADRLAAEEAAKLKAQSTPIPIGLRTELVRTSPGPYAAGDTVTVVARIVTDKGEPRPAGSGELTVTKADGSTEKVKGRAEADGTVRFNVTLPPGGDAQISVAAGDPQLQHREKPTGPIAPAATKLAVSPCRLRTRITSPQPNSPSTPGTTKLKGELVDAQGRPTSALNGAKLVFTAETSSGQKVRADASMPADGLLEATLELPKASGPEKVTFALVAEGGAGDVCPGPMVETPLSELGVGADLTRLPPKCYVDRPCKIDVTLRLPDDPAARPAAEAFANAPNLVATVNVGGVVSNLTPGAAGSFKGEPAPTVPGDLDVTVAFEVDGKRVEQTGRVQVRWPLNLSGPPELDLGEIQAGTSWQDTCKPLDLSNSTGVEEQDLEITAITPTGCESVLVGNFGGLRGRYGDAVTLEMDASRQIPVCLETNPCGTGEQPDGVKLVVRSMNPDFADQKIEVPVKFKVNGGSWLACNLWWIGALLGTIVFGAFAYGFIVPLDFSNDDVLRVASKEAALPRAAARRLRELPGGKRGWYRTARFGLRSDGSATKDVKTALISFEAGRSEIVATARGTLNRMNPRSHKLEPVPDPKEHSLSKNAVYEIGGLYFKVS